MMTDRAPMREISDSMATASTSAGLLGSGTSRIGNFGRPRATRDSCAFSHPLIPYTNPQVITTSLARPAPIQSAATSTRSEPTPSPIHGESGMPRTSAVTTAFFASLPPRTNARPTAGNQIGPARTKSAPPSAASPTHQNVPRHFRGSRGIRLDAILSRRDRQALQTAGWQTNRRRLGCSGASGAISGTDLSVAGIRWPAKTASLCYNLEVILGRYNLAILLFCFASLQVGRSQGNIASYNAGSEPPCNQAKRGSMIVVLGAAGNPDALEVCLRDGAGRYNWAPASMQNRNTFAHSRTIGGCPIFPDNNVWNSTVDKLPISPESAGIVKTYAASRLGIVPEFPINLADSKAPAGPVQFDASGESDQGRYPIAGNMKMEGSSRESPVSGAPYKSDSHLLVIQTEQCKLYEIFALQNGAPPFHGAAGAIYDLMANNLRPNGWTSADAAGLPIWPGVLTYAELYGGGEIRHMIRFTLEHSRNSYVWPARHFASRNGDVALPPMGSRWRVKASLDEGVCHQGENNGKPYPPEMKRLIHALKRYGMILADNGTGIRMTTDVDPRWAEPRTGFNAEYILQGWTHCLTGRDFEVVDASLLMVNWDSAETVGQ